MERWQSGDNLLDCQLNLDIFYLKSRQRNANCKEKVIKYVTCSIDCYWKVTSSYRILLLLREKNEDPFY